MASPTLAKKTRPRPRPDDRVERSTSWMRWGIALLACYAVARAAVAAITRPLWFDEIFTLVMARQPTVGGMWQAARQGVDSQPPLYDLVERATSGIANTELALRIPSILGFGAVLLCIYVFVQRRSGGVYALLAAAFALLTELFVTYAAEARPYSLVAACVALALVAYQRAAAARWVVLLAAALILGGALHYYTVFALPAFAAAEAVYSWRNSRIRPRLWLAFAMGAIPLALSWPLLARFRAIYGHNFWARPTLGSLVDTYGELLQLPFFWGMAIAIAAGVAVLGVLGAFSADGNGSQVQQDDEAADQRFLHEGVLVCCLLATPVTVFVATRLFHGGYNTRYFLYTVLAVPIALGLVLPRLGRPGLLYGGIAILGALAAQEGIFWNGHLPPRLGSPAATAEKMIQASGNAGLSVVVPDPLEFLSLSRYASRPNAARLTWLVDTAAALRYGGNDSAEKGLLALATSYPVNVAQYEAFRASHASFLLYVGRGKLGDWWPERLLHDGYRMAVLAHEREHALYLVER